MTSRPNRIAVLVVIATVAAVISAGLLFERRSELGAQRRVDDLARQASIYVWDLDQELARSLGQAIVDSEGYRHLRIYDEHGATWISLAPQVAGPWDGTWQRLGLVPSQTLSAPIVHDDDLGPPRVIGRLEVERPDTALFTYLQLAIVLALAGLSTRAWIERQRQREATRLLQLAEEKATRLEAEARAEQRERQLLEKRRLESLGRLAAGVAHDFNNVLTVILTSAEMIADDQPDPLVRAQGRAILDAADRAARLTGQLLAFGRRQVLEPRALDLNAVVQSFQPILERAAGDGVRLELQLAEQLGAVEADPSQIEQVLLNLVVNARDALPGGGRIVVETANVDGPGAIGGGAPLPTGRWVVLAVHDNGQGMDADTLANAFEPFFTTRPEGKGTGLGLATVHGITHQSGGEVTAASQPGKGTTITVALPRAAGPAAALPDELLSIPPGELNLGATVLLVDDRRQVREVMAKALRSYGLQVVEAEDGLMALTLARDFAGDFDLLVTDLSMPGISGLELAERMRSDDPQLRVLFVSGNAAGVVPEGFTAGPRTAVLHKPFGAGRLVAHVVALLDPPATG